MVSQSSVVCFAAPSRAHCAHVEPQVLQSHYNEPLLPPVSFFAQLLNPKLFDPEFFPLPECCCVETAGTPPRILLVEFV